MVLGADSTTTLSFPDRRAPVYLDHAQKLFQVGPEGSTVGLVTWGQGELGQYSHRTVAALFGELIAARGLDDIQVAAGALGELVWEEYAGAYDDYIRRVSELIAEGPDLDHEQDREFQNIVHAFTGGYCVGGRLRPADRCRAFEVSWDPRQNSALVREVRQETPVMWGVPHFMDRLIFGIDSSVVARIANSERWTGTHDELYDLVASHPLIRPRSLPIREAIDWIHTCIHTTIRGIKFASLPHSCGGPIEIGVITTDRPFRWVLHKPMDAATVSAQSRRVT